MLTLKKFQREDRKELGTISAIVGQGGKLKIIPANFNDPEKRVVLIVENKAGESGTVTCSKAVSEKLRSKELKIGQVAQFTVVEQLLENGETMNVVVMPASASNLVEFAIDSLKAEEYVPAKREFAPEDLVAL